MRGEPDRQSVMFVAVSAESLIPADHPIRRIRQVVEGVLADLDGEFTAMYAATGRPSVPPEQLLEATVLMALYSIRSERAFCERLNYDLLFKWFLDLPIDAPAFDATTFSKNRERLLDHEIAPRVASSRRNATLIGRLRQRQELTERRAVGIRFESPLRHPADLRKRIERGPSRPARWAASV